MTSFALFRLENELEDIHMLEDTSYKVIQKADDKFICEVEFTIHLKEGIYKGRTLVFLLKIPRGYPYDPPKAFCTPKIFHPNIDMEGRVCMEILREGWSCGYGLENIFINLYLILMEPSSVNPLNVEAGELLEKDYAEFVRQAEMHK